MDAVWTRDELISAYPELIDMPGRIGLTPWSILTRDVPEEFQDVIPYAELWGVGDDGTRDNLVDRAPATVLENLVHVVVPLGDRLDPWLAGPEASGPSYTDAYVAFSCLRMAAEYAVARLRRHSS